MNGSRVTVRLKPPCEHSWLGPGTGMMLGPRTHLPSAVADIILQLFYGVSPRDHPRQPSPFLWPCPRPALYFAGLIRDHCFCL